MAGFLTAGHRVLSTSTFHGAGGRHLFNLRVVVVSLNDRAISIVLADMR